jgi:hypothetical protein
MTATVMQFPSTTPPPEPTGDKFLDLIEMRIIREVVLYVQNGVNLGRAAGLSTARTDYMTLNEIHQERGTEPNEYLSLLVIAVKKLSPRQQSKLKHPARRRDEAQRVLLGEQV